MSLELPSTRGRCRPENSLAFPSPGRGLFVFLCLFLSSGDFTVFVTRSPGRAQGASPPAAASGKNGLRGDLQAHPSPVYPLRDPLCARNCRERKSKKPNCSHGTCTFSSRLDRTDRRTNTERPLRRSNDGDKACSRTWRQRARFPLHTANQAPFSFLFKKCGFFDQPFALGGRRVQGARGSPKVRTLGARLPPPPEAFEAARLPASRLSL